VLLVANILAGIVALLHVYFLVLEMFLWETPTGLRVFRMTPEKAAVTKTLAMNQGLYNGFLAAGLTWGIWLGPDGDPIRIFFLACIVMAGIFGAATVGKKILYVQALPAGAAMALLIFG
jgi:putative membrane protein